MITKRFRRFLLFVAVVSLVTLPSVLIQPKLVNASPREPNCCNSPYACLPETSCNFSVCECWCDSSVYPECCELYPWVPNCNGARKNK